MSLVLIKQNIASSNKNPEVVDKYIFEEEDKANFLGPLSPQSSKGYHINRIGVILLPASIGK